MKYANGHEFEFRYLKPDQIKIDPLYQRRLDTNRVNRIAKEFNGDLFNEPKVSYRDGQFWVFNGQHSIAAWRKYYGENKPVQCKVYKGMTWLEECEAFIAQNGISVDPTTNDKLSAALEARRPDVVGMVGGAELAGFRVSFKNSKATPNTICAASALFKAFLRLGAEQYIDMLTAIRDAWEGDPDAVCSQIINAMALFYKTYKDNFRREDLVNSLKRITPAAIIRNGRNVGVKNGFAREIVKQYNVKRKYRLNIDEL